MFSFKYAASNQRGLSLVEVLVVLGFVGIIAAVFTSILTQMQSQLKSSDAKMGSFALRDAIRNNISNRTLCSKAFDLPKVANINQLSLGLKLIDAVSIPSVNASGDDFPIRLPEYSIRVRPLQITTRDTGLKAPNGRAIYSANVILHAAPLVSTWGPAFRPAPITSLFLEYDTSSSQIHACYSTDDPGAIVSSACSSMGGEYNEATTTCELEGRDCQFEEPGLGINKTVTKVKEGQLVTRAMASWLDSRYVCVAGNMVFLGNMDNGKAGDPGK